MKNKLFLILTVLSSLAFAESSSDNYFCPTSGSISYEVNQYTVTFSQETTWDGVHTIDSELEFYVQPMIHDPWAPYKEKVTCIDVKTGRTGDAINAKKANALSEDYITGVPVTPDTVIATIYTNANEHKTVPAELNFAMVGTLTISTYFSNFDADNTYDCPNVIIGQGHYTGNNNWWVYNNAPGLGNNQLSCKKRSTGAPAIFQVTQAPNHPPTADSEGIRYKNVGPGKSSTNVYDYIMSFNLVQ